MMFGVGCEEGDGQGKGREEGGKGKGKKGRKMNFFPI